MNKQDKGNGNRGIEWTDYSWNPIGGCHHDCTWIMPDGQVAECYAKTIAVKLRSPTFFPEGFEHYYFHERRLAEPAQVRTPSRIFLDSMSDLMGFWVPEEHIELVLEAVRENPQHTFQLLTKNPKRLLKFDFPSNMWLGISMPPSQMFKATLSPNQQWHYMETALRTLTLLRAEDRTTFISFEPLSFDVAPIVARYPNALSWAIIGAASRGPKYYQPDPVHLKKLVDVLDGQGVRIFMKGNLRPSVPSAKWREEFPG